MINLDYKSGKSIHEQIQDGIKNLIMNGVMKEEEQLPSVRELSLSLTVNPNTVQKAYKELENNGYIYSVKGKGNFVAKIEKVNPQTVSRLLEELGKTVRELEFSGVKKEEIYKLIDEIYKKENSDDKSR